MMWNTDFPRVTTIIDAQMLTILPHTEVVFTNIVETIIKCMLFTLKVYHSR
jgi:hypothetical protein